MDLLSLHNSNASTTDFLFNQHEPITQTLHSHSALSGYPGNTTNSSPTFPNMCSTSLHDRYALNLRCVHNHTLQLHNERERKIPHWGACHAGEHATLRYMPRWGACHAGEHADRSPWIAYPFNALQMRRSFSPCRKHTTT